MLYGQDFLHGRASLVYRALAAAPVILSHYPTDTLPIPFVQ
jgi:hypothetical protein